MSERELYKFMPPNFEPPTKLSDEFWDLETRVEEHAFGRGHVDGSLLKLGHCLVCDLWRAMCGNNYRAAFYPPEEVTA